MSKNTEWPADQVERRKVSALIPYARNARTHSDSQVAQIAASMREWGFTVPILVDETGSVIAGHGRLLAAQQLELDEVPVMVARGWSESKKRAYVIADNKLALNAGWDHELLRVELKDLAADGFDWSLMGFSASELASAMGLVDEEQADTNVLGKESYSVLIECESESHQALVIEQLEGEGLKCRPLIS